jgi:hypothetical protein
VPRRLRKSAAVTVYVQVAPASALSCPIEHLRAASKRPGGAFAPMTGAGDLRDFERCTERLDGSRRPCARKNRARWFERTVSS